MVLTPSCVSGTVSVARFSEGPHLLLSAIYLIREPLLVYPSLSLFPFSVVAQSGTERTSRDAGNKCMLLRKRTPFASGPLSMYAWSRCSNTDRPLRSFSFRTDTGHGQRRARGSNACFFPFLFFLFFFLLLFFTLEKSERENADKSVEGTVIKQRMPLPLIVRKVHR